MKNNHNTIYQAFEEARKIREANPSWEYPGEAYIAHTSLAKRILEKVQESKETGGEYHDDRC